MKRTYILDDFKIINWDNLKPFYEELVSRKIDSLIDLKQWMLDCSEMSAVVNEDGAWRYIKMTCNTTDDSLQESFNYFVTEIEPNITPFTNLLNQKLIDSPFLLELTDDDSLVYLRSVKRNIELYRESNIPLITQLRQKEQEYGTISAAQTIDYHGEAMTLQKAATFFKSTDRKLREEFYNKIQIRRANDETILNELFSDLIKLRHQIALNTGYSNYRDFKHDELGRFDYKVSDCYNFHDAIQKYIVPLNKNIDTERKVKLHLDEYKPWDTSVDVDGKPALVPFRNAEDLIQKTISCFKQIDNYFAECISTMKTMNRLDLDSRIGKAPGGYNYPLMETDVPFIFMNSVGLHRDMVTMLHEGGHAVHSFLTADLALSEYKNAPSEVAELASMSIELISMEHWNAFFENEDDLKRAKKEQLESVLKGLPWIAMIDKFQHWIYTNPAHSVDERNAYWLLLCNEFGTGVINMDGLTDNLKRSWQPQLHLFEVPFYYIEYGMAQLGAIAVWRNYKLNPSKALQDYKNALALGYTKTIPEIYKTAGIKFDFSSEYIKELADFVQKEYELLC